MNPLPEPGEVISAYRELQDTDYCSEDDCRSMNADLLVQNGFSIKQIKSYGRIFTYSYWLSRIKKYPSFIYKSAEYIGRTLGIEDKIMYIKYKRFVRDMRS